MKILWIINGMPSDICEDFHRKVSYTGGWIQSAKNILSQNKEIKLGIASVYKSNNYIKLLKKDISYYLLPCRENQPSKYYKSLENYWRIVRDDFKPDIVHIYGTEYTHGLAYINACGNKNVIISIQGLISIIARHYCDGICLKERLMNITIGDILLNRSLLHIIYDSKRRGRYEIEAIKKTLFIEGRTSWDESHVWAYNKNAEYFSCNRFLRPSFYKFEWKYDECEKYSIFISQARDTIKGVHQVIKALPLILRDFPETILYVAGNNIWDKSTLRKRLLYSGYAKYLYRLAKKRGVEHHIKFTGSLDEEKMCSRLRKSHVFVSPSSIENSPNSLAEAQILGVPCISSLVGGVSDMVEHGRTGLIYRFEEYEMIAGQVCDIFSNKQRAMLLSEASKRMARSRHNIDDNMKKLYEIYNYIKNKQN